MIMARVQCLYCDVENDALQTSGYCDNCGKKLPSSALVKTRRSIVSDGEEDAWPGRSPRQPAVEALIVAAVVHLVAGGLFLIIGPALMPWVPEDFLTRVFVWALIPSAGVAAMAFLAQWQPGIASAVSVVAVLAWIGLTFVIDERMALPWLLVQAILLGLLVRALWVSRLRLA